MSQVAEKGNSWRLGQLILPDVGVDVAIRVLEKIEGLERLGKVPISRRFFLFMLGLTPLGLGACASFSPPKGRCEGGVEGKSIRTGEGKESVGLLPPKELKVEHSWVSPEHTFHLISPLSFTGCAPSDKKEVKNKVEEEANILGGITGTVCLIESTNKSGGRWWISLPTNLDFLLTFLEEEGEVKLQVSEVEIPDDIPWPILVDVLGTLAWVSSLKEGEGEKQRETLATAKRDLRALKEAVERAGFDPKKVNFLRRSVEVYGRNIKETFGPIIDLRPFWVEPKVQVKEEIRGDEETLWVIGEVEYEEGKREKIVGKASEELLETLRSLNLLVSGGSKVREEGEVKVRENIWSLREDVVFRKIWRVNETSGRIGLVWGLSLGKNEDGEERFLVVDPEGKQIEFIDSRSDRFLTEPVFTTDVTERVDELISKGVLWAAVTLQSPKEFLRMILSRCQEDLRLTGAEGLDKCAQPSTFLPVESEKAVYALLLAERSSQRGSTAVVTLEDVRVKVEGGGQSISFPPGVLLEIEKIEKKGEGWKIVLGTVSTLGGGERRYVIEEEDLSRVIIVDYKSLGEAMGEIAILLSPVVMGGVAGAALNRTGFRRILWDIVRDAAFR